MWCFSVVLLSEIGNMLDIQGKIKFCKELVVVWWTITRVVCVLCHRRKWGLWYTVGWFHLAAVCFSSVSFHFLLRKHHLWEQHLSLGSLLCPRGCCLPRAAARRSSLAKPQPWLQQGAIIYLIKPSLKTSKVIILHSDMDLRNKGVCEFFSPDTCSLVHTVGLCSCEHALIEERIIE